MKRTIADQIKDLENTRAAHAARLETIAQLSADEERSMDEAESEEFDRLSDEVEMLDADLVRLRKLEKINVAAAKPVEKKDGENPQRAAQARSPYITMERTLPKGTAFTRYVMAIARSKGNLFEASEFAKRWDDSTPEVATVIRAAVDAGSTTDADWASKLVEYQTMQNEFLELLRPLTILGRFGQGGIPALRQVPFNIRMVTQTQGGVYQWVGEGAAKPVGELKIGEVLLRWAKASGIIVVSDELMRFSTPAVEQVVRNDMLKGMAAFSDSQLVDPDIDEVPNVSPASLTFSATPVTATGTDAQAFRADLATILDKYYVAGLVPSSLVIIMSNRQATRFALMRNPLGVKEYPDMTPMGGMLEGYPVIASEAVPADTNGDRIVFVNAEDVLYADDGPVTIDASREASLQMISEPSATEDQAAALVSLWQKNLIALRAERYINWKKARAAAVQYIGGANYVGPNVS